MSKKNTPPFFCSQVVLRPNLSRGAKKRGGKIFAPKGLKYVGLFARQKCAFLENHGSTVLGRYLSIRSCSV